MEARPRCLVVLTALRFSGEYGTAALRSAAERGEDPVLGLVLDPALADAAAEQLADVGFLGDKLAHELRDTMAAEYRQRGEGHLAELVDRARDLGLSAVRRVVEGPFVDTVLAVAREEGVRRVLVVRLGRLHLSRVVFGSEIDRLVNASPVPVDVFRAGSGVWEPASRRRSGV